VIDGNTEQVKTILLKEIDIVYGNIWGCTLGRPEKEKREFPFFQVWWPSLPCVYIWLVLANCR
jgi:hypothetical protein